jgi:hypothetical protein
VPDVKLFNQGALDAFLLDLSLLRRLMGSGNARRVLSSARLGQGLEALLPGVLWVRFEHQGEDVLLTWQDGRGRFHTARGTDALDALEGGGLLSEGKVCNGPCGTWRPLDAFGKDASRPDGKNQRCLVCERRRARDNKARKRGRAD